MMGPVPIAAAVHVHVIDHRFVVLTFDPAHPGDPPSGLRRSSLPPLDIATWGLRPEDAANLVHLLMDALELIPPPGRN